MECLYPWSLKSIVCIDHQHLFPCLFFTIFSNLRKVIISQFLSKKWQTHVWRSRVWLFRDWTPMRKCIKQFFLKLMIFTTYINNQFHCNIYLSIIMYRAVIYYLQETLGANISGFIKDREDTQQASESWTSQLSREKKILKIGAWVMELFHILCSYSDFVHISCMYVPLVS